VVVTSKIVYPVETVTYLRKTGNAVTGIRTHDHESRVLNLTTTPPRHLFSDSCALVLSCGDVWLSVGGREDAEGGAAATARHAPVSDGPVST